MTLFLLTRNAFTHAVSAGHRASAWFRRHRRILRVLASILFVAMLIWAFGALNLSVWSLRPLPILGLFFILSPVSLLYGGYGLVLLARMAGVPMPLRDAVIASGWAQLAEALPIPGGAMVRAGALIRLGGTVGHSALLVTATAILWISLAAMGAGGALAVTHPGGWALLAIGLPGSVAVLGWIGSEAGFSIMVLTLLHRLIGLLLTAVRLSLAFSVLGLGVPLAQTLPFALAAIAGSAASIAPAGLGVSELLAAWVATGVAVSSAAAVIAVALNRLIAITSCAVFMLTEQLISTTKGRSNHEPRANARRR